MNSFHMVGNTHFDPAWLWTWDEAMASIRATFRSALDRMDEDPLFRYSFSTPAVFEWIENTDPALFERIRRRVREGRWDVGAEAWWLQPDCNTPSGESLVRQGLYGQKYLMEKFGVKADTMFNIDSFGHSAMMPQLLRKCGIANYVFTRPDAHARPLEDELFDWISPDGSQVTTYRCGGANDGCYPLDTAKCLRDRAAELESTGHDAMIVYGVSDHGGAPTKKAIADIRRMTEELKNVKVVFSDVPGFFRAQQMRKRGAYAGELQPMFYGPFSDHGEVKRNNRRAEYALKRAEAAGFIAKRLCGRAYSPDTLARAWKDTLFNQFHDILGGTCIPQVFTDARDQQGRAIHTANEETHFALQSVCRDIATFGDNDMSVWNVIAFNLTGTDFSGAAEAEVQWAWEFPWYQGGIELIDENGNSIPAQVITERSAIPGFRTRFAFNADIPAMGWRTYAVKKTGAPIERDLTDPGDASPFIFRAYEDAGDVWCFNTTSGYGAQLEEPVLTERRVVEKGEMFTRIKQVWKLRDSVMEERFSIYADGCTDWECCVNWNEKHSVLKLIPRAAAAEKVIAAIPAGYIERPMDGREYPAGEFLIWGDTALLTEGVFAYDTENGLPRLTLVRSPIFGDLRIGDLDDTPDYKYMGQGVHEARIRLVPRALSPDKAADLAEKWNAPPVIVCEANHHGDIPPAGSLLRADGLALMALKPAEDGNGTTLRLMNMTAREKTADLALGDTAFTARFAPCEIKTFVIPDNGSPRETDMLEE